jgi:aldehyde:ferredoxin oxidoreductase
MVGERVVNMARLLNLKCGLTCADDRLPKLLTTPLEDGGTGGHAPDIDALLAAYYEHRGWDSATGVPRPEKLAELGL